MSDYLSTYKAELIERHIKNQISNAEKDTLHALLQRSNRSTLTVIERDVFAKLTLWRLLHAPAPPKNVNVKVHASVPLEGIRTLEASEQAQKSVKNKPIFAAHVH